MNEVTIYDVALFFSSTKKYQSILPLLKVLTKETRTTDIPKIIQISYRQLMRDLKELELDEFVYSCRSEGGKGRPCLIWELSPKGLAFYEILLSVSDTVRRNKNE